MKNSITVTIPFSFKGKEHTPTTIIDLDAFVKSDQTLDFIFHQVATENNIGSYSYEYEVLESSTKIFSNATGLAVKFVTENNFDLDGFKQALKEGEFSQTLEEIALNHLQIEDLDKEEKLKQALVAAYQAGKSAS